MVNWENSYKFGEKVEEKVLPLLKKYFNENVERSPKGRWSKYDYHDDEANYELKARTNKMQTYPTTMITSNKCEGADDKPLYLLFNYTDCLAYIQYDKEKFDKYEQQKFSRAGLDWDEKLHYYIPIDHLKVIQSY